MIDVDGAEPDALHQMHHAEAAHGTAEHGEFRQHRGGVESQVYCVQ